MLTLELPTSVDRPLVRTSGQPPTLSYAKMDLLCPRCTQSHPARPIDGSPRVFACQACGALAHVAFTGVAVGTLGRSRQAARPGAVEVIEALVPGGLAYRSAGLDAASLRLRVPRLYFGSRSVDHRQVARALLVGLAFSGCSVGMLLLTLNPDRTTIAIMMTSSFLLGTLVTAIVQLRPGKSTLELVGGALSFEDVDKKQRLTLPVDQILQLFCGRRRVIYTWSTSDRETTRSNSTPGWCFELRALLRDGSTTVLLAAVDPDVAFFAEVLLEERLGIADAPVAPHLLVDNLSEGTVQQEPPRFQPHPLG